MSNQKGRIPGAKGKKPSRSVLKAKQALSRTDIVLKAKADAPKPAFITYCYGCNSKITSNNPIEREIDGTVRKLCRSCAQKLEGADITRDTAGTYKKKKISDWERGRREAILCGGGRWNDI